MNIKKAKWIASDNRSRDFVPVFRRTFQCKGAVASAELEVTACGVYDAYLNGRRVGNFIMAPGWTEYEKRIQVQSYDIAKLLSSENELQITVANGWMRRDNPRWTNTQNPYSNMPAIMIASIHIRYEDGTDEFILTDKNWSAGHGSILAASIYDGEVVDARIDSQGFTAAQLYDYPHDTLIPQQGVDVIEQECIFPCKSFHTPKGEWVLDFGQNLTGYMEFDLDAKAGEKLRLSTAEVLDSDGNFYTANYRDALSRLEYICKDGKQSYKPRLSFFGFRYLRIDEAPEGFTAAQIRAIVLHSDIQQTGWLESGDPLLNQLFRNIQWGQKGNYLDIPTDCPQRDERLGWTGDAQVFVKTASYSYDVRRFFKKWLADLAIAQTDDGWVPDVVPNVLNHHYGSAAWGDAVTICPWQLYMTYGDVGFLSSQFEGMCKWVDFITNVTTTPYLWTGGDHYADWLGLDSEPGSYKGASDESLIASAFYAHSTRLTIEAGKILGYDVKKYEELYSHIVAAFKASYATKLTTQTEKVLALQFNLLDDPQTVADALAKQVNDCGIALQTGFVGTPYLLHVLSRYGHTDLAYSLLLRKEYPSWLYSVSKGATTIWEHWDGLREDGSFWSNDMNSFNHYAYGAVADWVYEVACGIRPAAPGFAKAIIEPHPDSRIPSLSAKINTVHGEIYSGWYYIEDRIRYEIRTPVPTEVRINGKTIQLESGSYVF